MCIYTKSIEGLKTIVVVLCYSVRLLSHEITNDTVSNMKATDLEAMVIDLDAQVKQLREELHELNKLVGGGTKLSLSDKEKRQKDADVKFTKILLDAIKVNAKHPFVEGRDVFTTQHLFLLAQQAVAPDLREVDPEIDVMGNTRGVKPGQINYHLGQMCKRLRNSGLVDIRSTQRYVHGSPEDNIKPSTRRRTAVIVRNKHKYKDMSDTYLGKELDSQTRRAIVKNNQMLAETKRQQSTELAEEPSFL